MKLCVTPWKNNRHNGRIKFQVEDIKHRCQKEPLEQYIQTELNRFRLIQPQSLDTKIEACAPEV